MMPVIAAIAGAVATGFFYWLIWGRGLDYLELRWREGRDRKRDVESREAAILSQRTAPLRSITEARDAAAVLMCLVAGQRGVPTPEQRAEIALHMAETLQFGSEVPHRLSFALFAAQNASAADDAIDALAPLLRDRLDRAECNELLDMLSRVAEVHGGPTTGQEKLIARVERSLTRPA
jgi:hypothetical protein